MNNNRGDRPLERRYRVRPLRLAASAILLCIVVGAVIILPRNLGFLLRVPAPGPLGTEGGEGFAEVASMPYAGRCVAARVLADGTALAAVLNASHLEVYSAFADGSHLGAQCAISGEIGPAAFLPSGLLVVWTTERAGGGGGAVHGFGPITKNVLAQTPVGAAWTCHLEKSGAGLLALPAGVGALYCTEDGTPAGCAIISATGKQESVIDVRDGLFTAWDAATATGLIGLGGAEYTGHTPAVSSFVRAYLPDGSSAMMAETTGTAPLRLAASTTGSHLLYATSDRLTMINNKGEMIWSRRVAGDTVRRLHVFPDGRAFLAGPDAGICLDDRGRVVGRWGLTGSGQVGPGPAEAAVLSLPGGAVAIDSTGKVVAQVLWDGPSQLIAVDQTGHWLLRADGASFTLYGRE